MRLSAIRYIFLPALLLPFSLVAQIVVKGNISDAESSEPVQNVIVKVCHTTSCENIISYTVSNREGNYILRFQTTDKDVVLEFSLLGYETIRQKIKAESATVNQQLHFSSQLLKEVTIKAPPISARNDTINYNVAAFISQSDRNVEDILRKLPGITVQQNGQIEYQGKPINKFYIEGLDMLEGRYNLATQNIAANQITTVQVYENHQPVRLLKGVDFSEKAALNIKLKDKKMSRPVGNFLIGGGYGEEILYRAEVFGFMANTQQQLLFSSKANNSGISSISELSSHYNANDRNIKAGSFIDPLPFMVPQQVLMRTKKTTDLSTSINTIRKIDKQTNIKLNLLHAKAQKSYQRAGTSSYFSGENAIIIQEEMEAINDENTLSAMGVYEKNANSIFIKNATNAQFNYGSANADIIMNTQKRQNYSIKKLLFNNDLSLVWRKKNNIYNIQSLIVGGVMPENKLHILLHPNYSKPVTQENSGRMLYTKTSSSFIRGFNAYSNLSINLMVETEYDKIDTHLNNQSENIEALNNNSGYKIISTLSPAYSYDNGNIRIKIHLPLVHAFIRYKDELKNKDFRYDKPYVSPQIHSKYIFSPAFFITASAKLNYTTGDIMSFIKNPIQTTHNRVQHSRSGILEHRKNAVISVGYDYRNTMSGLFSSFKTHYSRIRKNIIKGSNISDNRIISSLTTGAKNYSHNYISNFYLAKNFQEAQTTAALTCNYTHSINEKIRQNKQVRYTNNILAIIPSVNFRAIKWLSLSIQNPVHVFTQSIHNTPSAQKSKLVNWGTDIDITFLPTKNIELFYTLEYQNSSAAIKGKREQWAFMDIGMRYQPTKTIELSLKLQNITNVKIYTLTNYQDADKFITRYHLRPFNGMINFKYSF